MSQLFQRNTTIDIAKGIGILLVVLCHANFAPASPGRFFHMPLFFFITGYLSSFDRPFTYFLKKKIKSLYIPFLICECVFVVLHNPFYKLGIVAETYTIKDIFTCIFHILLFANSELLLAPLWFATALFFANIICYLLCKIPTQREYTNIILSFLLCCCGMLCTRLHLLTITSSYDFKESINVILVAQFFCVLGHYFKKYGYKLQIKSHTHYFLFILLLASCAYLFLAKLYWGLSVDMRINRYSNIALFGLACASGFYVTFILSKYLSRTKLLGKIMTYIGKNSLAIFFLHIFCFKLVGLLQVHIFGFSNELLSQWSPVYTGGGWSLV